MDMRFLHESEFDQQPFPRVSEGPTMASNPDFSTITESPGLPATAEQLERLRHRYRFALPSARGQVVLEVACGAGLGLGLLASEAASVMGGDIDPNNVEVAAATYASNPKVRVSIMDALNLPFPEGSFGLVLLYEAVYYLPDASRFIAEALRVLTTGGTLAICSTNPERAGFHPSPYVYRYYSASDLKGLLERGGLSEVQVAGGFPATPSGIAGRLTSLIKRAAVKLNLIPGSLSARAWLKRIFLGPLKPLPADLSTVDYSGAWVPPVPLDTDVGPCREFTVVYATGRKAVSGGG